MELRAEYDVIVVGSGAAGGWAAKSLTEKGLEVLVLEAGPALDAEKDFPPPETQSATLGARHKEILINQPVQAKCFAFADHTRHLYVNDRENPYTTPWHRPFRWIR